MQSHYKIITEVKGKTQTAKCGGRIKRVLVWGLSAQLSGGARAYHMAKALGPAPTLLLKNFLVWVFSKSDSKILFPIATEKKNHFRTSKDIT